MLQKLYKLANFVEAGPCVFFGIVFLGIAFIASVTHNPYHRQIWSKGGLVSIILTVVLGGLMFLLARMSYKFRSISRAYSETFKLAFPTNRTERTVEQPAINLELKRLAAMFYSACDYKNHLLGTLPSLKSIDNVRVVQTRLVEVRNAEEQISRHKKTFWQAHTLARKAGLWTLKKSGDYLELK